MSTTKRSKTKREPAKASSSKARPAAGSSSRARAKKGVDEEAESGAEAAERKPKPKPARSRSTATKAEADTETATPTPTPKRTKRTKSAPEPEAVAVDAAPPAPEPEPALEPAPAVTPAPIAEPDPAPMLASEPSEPAPKKSRSKKIAPPPEPPAPPRPVYTLDGPVPAEGASLPPKVGALLGVGQQTLGIKSFRPGQAEAFDHLLGNEDLLAVMPTGSGKSLLYQLTSMVVPGVTVVVSPLIALIKDQLDKMVAKGVSAAKIDSTLTVKQRREVDALIRAPGGKLLLTTPERMADPDFRTFLREACGGIGVSRFVVDEAHCVSQWGHDFRPAYLSLRKALEDVGRPPVLATTATAPPHVRDDILFQLGIEGATTVTTTFDRPNLHYEVIIFSDEDEKMKTLVTLLKKLPRPGIVYCATVKKVEELYEALTRWGVPVGKYHGRMTKKERDESQNTFMASAEIVMVATNAFGLGVDKPNIRNVLHYHVPGSLEAYAQEAGRGGRDGRPARCVLLFSPDDVAIQEYFLSGTYPTKRQVKMVFEALGSFRADDSPPTIGNIAIASGVGQQRTRTVLSLLKDEGYVLEKEGGLFYVADPPPPFEELMERAKQYEARRIADRQRLDSLLAYVKAPGCRNQVILQYLGEPEPPKCGRCDNCLRSREAALAASTEATRFGAMLTRQLDDEGVEIVKPRREIKARVVRIDQPQPELPAAAVSETAPAPKPATVLRRSSSQAAPAVTPPPAASPPVLRRSAAPAASPVPAPLPPAAVPPPVPVADAKQPIAPTPGQEEWDDDDELDDDELEDDEDDEDGDEEGDDASLEGDEDDEDLDDDEDDDDEDDDDLDDDDEDDDDYEVIDKTAAELAEEGLEGPGEITVLARKKVPKQPKLRAARPVDDGSNSASAAEARRRRRRRRRKRRAMLPPKSAFTTPVLSTASPLAEAQPRRGGGGGGPVIEYVRGPMRIATAPVASANPNDAGVGRRRGGGRTKPRGWERNGTSNGRNFDRRPNGAGGGGPRVEHRGPRPMGPPNGAPPDGAALLNPDGTPRKRRRRRRRRPGQGQPMNNGVPMQTMPPNGAPADGASADAAPVAFFTTADGSGNNAAPMLGPDGQPLRKRRRRRRRGRGGKQREWRGAAGAEGGAPAGDGGGGDGGGGGGEPAPAPSGSFSDES